MKELSIEEKARRYDEAIKVAQRFYNNSVAITKKGLEDIFPELKESEDERIRKSLLRWVQSNSYTSIAGIPIKDIIAWFEKQCEQKPAWSEDDENGLGDALWAIQQARTIAKDENDMGNLWYAERWLKSLKGRCAYQPKQEWSEEDGNRINRLIAYFEDKESFTAEDDIVYANWLKSLRPQKQFKWSEEDIVMHNDCICAINAASEADYTAKEKERLTNWLRSIRPQKQWKPSDEQMQALSNAGNSFRPFEEGHKVLWSLYNDLKKLKG